jgi:hypothetical protein
VSLHGHASRRRRRLRATITALSAVLLLAGCASSTSRPKVAAGGQQISSTPAGVTVTKTRVFAPYDRSGAPTAGVVAHRSGSCFTASITVAARGAFRCFAANKILDPCFVVPGSTHLLDCYPAPWSRATQLRVAHLPKVTAVGHVSRPWAIELQGGVRCVVTNGTADIVRHVALGYQCPDGAAGLTAGGGSTKHALYQATDGLVRTMRVTATWRVD